MANLVKDVGSIHDLRDELSEIIAVAALQRDGKVHFYKKGGGGSAVTFDVSLGATGGGGGGGGASNNALIDDGQGNRFTVLP